MNDFGDDCSVLVVIMKNRGVHLLFERFLDVEVLRGLDISMLMPPGIGSSDFTVRTISSGFSESISMLSRLRTVVQLETIMIRFPFVAYWWTSVGGYRFPDTVRRRRIS